MGRRRSLAISIATIAAVVIPAAAQAATYTVAAGGGTCGGGDLSCETLAAAAAQVANNDTVNVSPGQYASATFNNSGLTIAGSAPGVVVNGSVVFSATGAGLLRNMTIAQTSGSTPAITASGPGLEVRDVIAVSVGDGMLISSGTTNKIVRSTLVSAGAGSGVQVSSSDATVKALRLESSLVSGGVGLRAGTTAALAGAITIDAHHLTAVGSGNGLRLEGFLLAGNVSATITDSIALNNLVVPVPLFPASATLTPGGANITTGDRSAIFADPSNGNFRLKPGSPAIDAGAFTAGESTTDFDGQARPGPVTDLGADEYVNTAPKAAIAVTTKLPRDGQPVEFDGSGSRDQPGGSIATYLWAFGDGATQTTTGPTVSHVYKGEGPVTAKLVVVDGEGAMSAPASAPLTILDGGAPAVTITTPKSKQKLNVITTRTKTVTKNGVKTKVKTSKRTRIRFAGAATDKNGVQFVLLTVEKISNPPSKTVAQGRASTKKCTWLDPKKGLRKTSCNKPIIIKAKLTGGTWAYGVRSSIKLSKGGYRVIAYGVDKSGNVGNAAAKSQRNISFTLR